jgi:hypothetical protein
MILAWVFEGNLYFGLFVDNKESIRKSWVITRLYYSSEDPCERRRHHLKLRNNSSHLTEVNLDVNANIHRRNIINFSSIQGISQEGLKGCVK